MADRAEVDSQTGSDIGACAELAFDDSSSALLPELDSADIIPEAAMKCGILPLDGDSMEDLCMPTENLPLKSPTDMTESVVASPTAIATDVVTSTRTSSPASAGSASAAAAAATGEGSTVRAELCAGCRRPITERYLLRALDSSWHEDCLRCSCCDCRLGEVGSTLFTRSNLLLCRRDYLRLFGTTGYCSACSKLIPAFEMIMKARNNVYHLECFACQRCSQRFCIGDRFYLHDNRILCEYDYVEQRTAAQSSSTAAAASSTTPAQPPPPRSCLDPAGTTPPPLCSAAAAQMKRHAQLQQLHQHQQQYLHPHPPHQHAATMDGCVNW